MEFIAANTDLQVLKVNRAAQKIQLGLSTSKGMGAGVEPRGRPRRPRSRTPSGSPRRSPGSDMVFVTAGMGGGTGTGAAPVVAKIASEAGALVVAIVSKPFAFEGRRKLRFAEDGIAELREYVDTLITIPNERLYAFVDRNITAWEAFKIADDVLRQAVQGISDLITVPGYVNVDFADVKTVMENMGMALMGTGTATGEHRAVEAAQKAISNPLLEEQSIQGARAILINVTGGEDLTLAEFNEACQIVQQAADDDANIIFGLVQDARDEGPGEGQRHRDRLRRPRRRRAASPPQPTERARLPLTEETVPGGLGLRREPRQRAEPEGRHLRHPDVPPAADGLTGRTAPGRGVASARVVRRRGGAGRRCGAASCGRAASSSASARRARRAGGAAASGGPSSGTSGSRRRGSRPPRRRRATPG